MTKETDYLRKIIDEANKNIAILDVHIKIIEEEQDHIKVLSYCTQEPENKDLQKSATLNVAKIEYPDGQTKPWWPLLTVQVEDKEPILISAYGWAIAALLYQPSK